jgi:hypothetical protein
MREIMGSGETKHARAREIANGMIVPDEKFCNALSYIALRYWRKCPNTPDTSGIENPRPKIEHSSRETANPRPSCAIGGIQRIGGRNCWVGPQKQTQTDTDGEIAVFVVPLGSCPTAAVCGLTKSVTVSALRSRKSALRSRAHDSVLTGPECDSCTKDFARGGAFSPTTYVVVAGIAR